MYAEKNKGPIRRFDAKGIRASEKVELYWYIRTSCKFIDKQNQII